MSVETDTRVVAGKWIMGETLGKGGYSWVKKGRHRETGQTVALKFTHKHQRWDEHDEATITTEVQALQKMSKNDHPNVMKIHEVNMNCPYPTKGGQDPIQTILFVLEYAAGGELFDILYYTGKLDEDIARTYFHQLVQGLEHLHKAGICHRDLKPQNLLLSERMELKITDFGLSKIMESDEDHVMRTTHVGTKGFQSPEQLASRPYSVSTDIFAAGVCLFILMTGYPPFEHAIGSDYWYKDLMTGRGGKQPNPGKFWRKHRDANIAAQAQDFINNLLAADPHKRFTIDQIREHPWFNGTKLTQEQLNKRIGALLQQVKEGRMNDVEKQLEQKDSVKRRAGVAKQYDPERVAPSWKDANYRGLTTFRTKAHPDAIRDAINEFATGKGHSDTSVDYHVKVLVATKNQKLEFEANIYNDADTDENVVTIRRQQGGFVEYSKFYNMLLNQALYPLNVDVA